MPGTGLKVYVGAVGGGSVDSGGPVHEKEGVPISGVVSVDDAVGGIGIAGMVAAAESFDVGKNVVARTFNIGVEFTGESGSGIAVLDGVLLEDEDAMGSELGSTPAGALRDLGEVREKVDETGDTDGEVRFITGSGETISSSKLT